MTDAITTDLLSYRQRIKDLKDFKNSAQPCAGLISVTDKERNDNIQCVAITSNKDDDGVNQNMVSRTITYSVDLYNVVSYSQEAGGRSDEKEIPRKHRAQFCRRSLQSSRWIVTFCGFEVGGFCRGALFVVADPVIFCVARIYKRSNYRQCRQTKYLAPHGSPVCRRQLSNQQ